MKTYEKPSLMVLSLNSNEVFCSSCEIDFEGPNMDDDYEDLLFGKDEDCFHDHDIEDYCKFASNAEGLLFNS